MKNLLLIVQIWNSKFQPCFWMVKHLCSGCVMYMVDIIMFLSFTSDQVGNRWRGDDDARECWRQREQEGICQQAGKDGWKRLSSIGFRSAARFRGQVGDQKDHQAQIRSSSGTRQAQSDRKTQSATWTGTTAIGIGTTKPTTRFQLYKWLIPSTCRRVFLRDAPTFWKAEYHVGRQGNRFQFPTLLRWCLVKYTDFINS